MMRPSQVNPRQVRTVTRHGRDRSLRTLMVATLCVVLLLLVACGGSQEEDGERADAAGPAGAASDARRGGIPTMPAARFAAPTTMIDATKVAAAQSQAMPEAAAELDPALGEETYVQFCAECHGDAGQGVADKGEAVVGLEIESAAFADLLRTGGGHGDEHIFGPDKISDDGIEGLLAYMQILGESQ